MPFAAAGAFLCSGPPIRAGWTEPSYGCTMPGSLKSMGAFAVAALGRGPVRRSVQWKAPTLTLRILTFGALRVIAANCGTLSGVPRKSLVRPSRLPRAEVHRLPFSRPVSGSLRLVAWS